MSTKNPSPVLENSEKSSAVSASPVAAMSPSDPADAWWVLHERLYRETAERQARLAERRAERLARLREDRVRAFGDLCEASEGRAVVWRREGISAERLSAFADAIGDAWLGQTLLRWLRLTATREIDRCRHAERRAKYYERERGRRRELALERRKIRRRSTVNPCPTKEQVLDAWLKARNSDADLIRFGSLMEDLECYVDNSLRRDEGGEIIGRNGGVKEWLHENVPVLYLRYSTVMRYKSAARKLRQLAGIGDPVPAAWIVEERNAEMHGEAGRDAALRCGTAEDGGEGCGERNCGGMGRASERERREGRGGRRRGGEKNEITVRTKLHGGDGCRRTAEIARAWAVYHRLTTPAPASRTAFMARLDGRCGDFTLPHG